MRIGKLSFIILLAVFVNITAYAEKSPADIFDAKIKEAEKKQSVR